MSCYTVVTDGVAMVQGRMHWLNLCVRLWPDNCPPCFDRYSTPLSMEVAVISANSPLSSLVAFAVSSMKSWALTERAKK